MIGKLRHSAYCGPRYYNYGRIGPVYHRGHRPQGVPGGGRPVLNASCTRTTPGMTGQQPCGGPGRSRQGKWGYPGPFLLPWYGIIKQRRDKDEKTVDIHCNRMFAYIFCPR